MLRETSFRFKVLAAEPIDNGIINPELFSKSATFVTSGGGASKLDAATVASFDKVLPGDIGMIDGMPNPDIFAGFDWGY